MENRKFAERLRRAMEQSGMNQVELAGRIGASKSAVSQYLSGINVPGNERMQAIAEATGVSFPYLLGCGEDAERPEPPVRRIRVDDAARCLGISSQRLREALINKRVDFGFAIPPISGTRWTYVIPPAKFRECIGAEQFDAYFGGAKQ